MDPNLLLMRMKTKWSAEETGFTSDASGGQFVRTGGDEEIGECSLPVKRDWGKESTFMSTCGTISNGCLTVNEPLESDHIRVPLYHSPNPSDSHSLVEIKEPGSKKRVGLVTRTHSPKVSVLVSLDIVIVSTV